MYILHAMNTYIPDDLRRVSVSLLSWHRNTRMESAGNNIKRPNDDVALPVINTLRSRFLGLLRLYRWHELGVVGSIALGLHYVLCSQLYKSGILNGIRILNSSVWRPQLHYFKYVTPYTGRFKMGFFCQHFLICFKKVIVLEKKMCNAQFILYICLRN